MNSNDPTIPVLKESTLDSIQYRIIKLEQENIKTKEKNEAEMKELIMAIIREEANKNC